MIIPKPLQKGDKIAILATAKRLESSYDLGIDLLKGWGLVPVIYDSANAASGYFAGDDSLRADDFQQALNDDSIRAILFLRGGYGSTRIIDEVDFGKYTVNPKWLIGFSDLTSILLKSIALNVPAIHGQVAVTLGRDKKADEVLKRMLFGESSFDVPLSHSDLTIPGQTVAPIVGGNLCMICNNLSTASEIVSEGKVLFLEEVGEEFYAVDRMMTQLKRAGKLDNLKGLILGDFSSISDRQSYFKKTIQEWILRYFKDSDIPIATNLSAGHEKVNYPLLFGCKTEIEVTTESLKLRYLK